MDIIADFIVLEADDYQSVLQEETPTEGRLSASWNGLTEVNIVQLWSILLDVTYTDERRKSLNILTTGPAEEKWLVVFPRELVSLLSNLEDLGKIKTEKAWAKTEEFKWGWKKKDVSDLLSDLIMLSKEADKKNEALILWGSL